VISTWPPSAVLYAWPLSNCPYCRTGPTTRAGGGEGNSALANPLVWTQRAGRFATRASKAHLESHAQQLAASGTMGRMGMIKEEGVCAVAQTAHFKTSDWTTKCNVYGFCLPLLQRAARWESQTHLWRPELPRGLLHSFKLSKVSSVGTKTVPRWRWQRKGIIVVTFHNNCLPEKSDVISLWET
jgi:hypothetical protein